MASHGRFQETLSNQNSKAHIVNKSCTEYPAKNTILFLQKSKLTDVRVRFITHGHMMSISLVFM